MKRLRFSQRFVAELKKITEHIAKDKPQSARAFKDALLAKIKGIPAMPYSYRQSPIADDECVRELIFKGFVVVFVISDSIDVLGIYKQNLWEMWATISTPKPTLESTIDSLVYTLYNLSNDEIATIQKS